jgi:hypothetical protein
VFHPELQRDQRLNAQVESKTPAAEADASAHMRSAGADANTHACRWLNRLTIRATSGQREPSRHNHRYA